MKKIILARCGELMLKGLNRPYFERTLGKNIRNALRSLGKYKLKILGGRIFVEPADKTFMFDEAVKNMTKVFGLVSVSPAFEIEKDYNTILDSSLKLVKENFDPINHNTFKVEAKRADKNFPKKSPELCADVGEYLLNNTPELKVDVRNPSFTLYIEIRDSVYIYTEIISGGKGLPVGTNGKAMLLLSGGIDSPVAGWMMSKRGVELEAVHFYSYPYTSERSKDKVIELARILSIYCGGIKLHIVPFTDAQLEIRDKCSEQDNTVIMRRLMMRIAERLSVQNGCLALITGESMGQVASQTIQALSVTNSSVSMPVFRPLIGMDKTEVVDIARRIETYETSILPYEDCCTVFVAKHPRTKPVNEFINQMECALDSESLIEFCINNTETIII